MKMIECDICEKRIYFGHKVIFFDGKWNGNVDYDLCNDCNKKFRKFFKNVRRPKPKNNQ